MSLRLAIRHLPPGSTVDSVGQTLEQVGINAKQEQVKIHRVLAGKPETKVKDAVPAVAFIEAPSAAVALRVYKALETINIRCEKAFLQHVPVKTISTSAKLPLPDSVQFGTWKDDPEYAHFQESLKPKTKPPVEDNPAEKAETSKPESKPILAPLLEHFKKKQLALKKSRNQKQQQKKDGKKRKAATPATDAGTAEDSSTRKAEKGQKQQPQQKQQKKRQAPKAPLAEGGTEASNPQEKQPKKKGPGQRPAKTKPDSSQQQKSAS